MSRASPSLRSRRLFSFDNTYASLPSALYAAVDPVPVKAPRMVLFNTALAERLGLDTAMLASKEGVAIFSGNSIPESATPIAQAYAGHQFGSFTMLGDGRAVLLGEQVAPDGARFDIQLKGSGRTPFSRGGDGRAALGPMLREYIISEAMQALGIPTSRSLAVVTTGEEVQRETSLPGAVLTRVAASHIRVGTFEYAVRLGDKDLLRALADYTIGRHYPEAADADDPYLAFFEAVVERQASLIAHWMGVGFIHGVMNTDNMALSGETIDYGPCAFMDHYHPATVFSSIDFRGRYAYGNQPPIAQWNLARFAEALLPLLHDEPNTAIAKAETVLAGFRSRYEAHWLRILGGKLGLTEPLESDRSLITELLDLMQEHHADFTNGFRALAEGRLPGDEAAFQPWQARWQVRLGEQNISSTEARKYMRQRNPAVIPRNHKVEEMLAAAVEREDLESLQKLLRVLTTPYEQPADTSYCAPDISGMPYQTFCGT